MVKPVFGYWKYRGLCEPIRYLLYYKNVDFEDFRIPRDGTTWEGIKYNLGLDFPNLPYYIDENVKLTQSTTILRYLATKYDLAGKTEEEKLRVSLAEQQIIDFRQKFFNFVIDPNYENIKEQYLKKTKEDLNMIADFLGDRKYLAGEELTYVDFIAFDIFDSHILFQKTILDRISPLKVFQETIENLPEVKKYRNSSTFCKWPIVGPYNAWGGAGEMPQ
ncbi:glutathione S-transferase class-mu 26 kDa isozyme 47-like [Parasteatoda tepidariorum]|uniref:glutathione S-transferase class-mu 26 kDa isozyme 47-like n=1 Tax=Parasteatoda tepidariorum TaxID=114398 RepID=UPI001C71C3C3|nr:glutathione S-transferase class-mu 26 kDa isozyme 47-like [Parasteatoda tepidariorum]